MASNRFYKVGGALVPGEPSFKSYVKRPADEELFGKLRAGQFCYVLSTRQMGKTSLMARTLRRLRRKGTLTSVVDLTRLGTRSSRTSADQWCYGFAVAVLGGLRIKGVQKQTLRDWWWSEWSGLPPTQKMVKFLSDLVLGQTTAPIVVFVDEIDSTQRLPFSDDFFAAVRSCHEARATEPQFNRLTFALLGVASPTDLINDPYRTPFNVATRIDLSDFTPEEVRTLAEGLGSDLRLMPAVNDVSGIPTAGKSLIILAIVDHVLHFRIFDGDGKVVMDTDEKRLTEQARGLEDLGEQLEGLWPPHKLTNSEKGQVIDTVTSIVGHTRLGNDPTWRGVVLERVLYWTDGHPYLTQKVLQALADTPASGSVPANSEIAATAREAVDQLVDTAFLAPGANPTDENLDFVLRRVIGRGNLTAKMLRVYRKVRDGTKPVREVANDPVQTELKLVGLIKPRADGMLQVRNRIYAQVFDSSWVRRALPTDWRMRALSVSVALLLLTPAGWYELVLPRQLVAQIRQAPENFPDGRESYGNTYRRLRRIPFYSGTADAEWAAFGLKRMQRAISNDSSFLDPLIRRDAYRLIHDAWAQRDDLMGIPSFESKSKSLLAEFFKRCADYAGITERRDDAILWWLKALTVAPDVEDYRRAAGQLVGTDYDRLVRTTRLFSAIPGSRLVTALSCDGRRFAVSERGLRVWDLERPALPPIALRDRPAEITFDFDFLKFSPNGRLLAATGQDSAVFVWDLQRPEEPLKPIMGSEGGSYVVAISTDNKRLAAVDVDRRVRVWDLGQSKPSPMVISASQDRFGTLAFSPSSRRLAAGGRSGLVVWDLSFGNEKTTTLLEANEPVSLLNFGPDDRRLVTGNSQGGVCVWDLGRDKEPSIRLDALPMGAVVLSPDGHRLATGHSDGIVSIWNLDRVGQRPSRCVRRALESADWPLTTTDRS